MKLWPISYIIIALTLFYFKVDAQKMHRLEIIPFVKATETDSIPVLHLQLVGPNNYIKTWTQQPGTPVRQNVFEGQYQLSGTAAGYAILNEAFTITKDTFITVTFLPAVYELSTVIIKHAADEEVRQNVPGMDLISIENIKKIPAILGEPDALKAIQFTPGVQTGGEGTSGFFIRGGSHDQNLFLWDGTPLYNVTHMLGLLSVFNPDVVQDVTLYKGGFPAQYGGRLSSVIDIKSRDGNRYKQVLQGGIGLIASRLTFETPFAKNAEGRGRGSLIISGRRTYADVFTRPINALNKNKPNRLPIPTYFFHDFNGKIVFDLSKNHSIYTSFYTGTDFVKYAENNGINYKNDWSNTAFSIGNRLKFSDKLALDASIFHTGFGYNVYNETDVYSLGLQSKIKDYGTRANFTYKEKNVGINFGGMFMLQQFSPQNIYAEADIINLEHTQENTLHARQSAAFAEIYNRNDKILSLSGGLRLASYTFAQTNYVRPEPRLSMRLILLDGKDGVLSFKTAYTRMNQFLHLISNGMASFPTDVWYPATQNIAPQQSDMVSAGFYKSFGKGKYVASVESYYKKMNNVVEYAEGADILFQPQFEENLVMGKGHSYGGELGLKYDGENFNYMLAYTLSWSLRQFDEKNFGNQYFANFDRRHNFNIAGSYKINERAELNVTWIFASGNPVTLPVARFRNNVAIPPYSTGITLIFSEKNIYRMPAFHHLDVNFVWKFKPKKGESSLSFGVYNLYARRNPYFIFIQKEVDENLNLKSTTLKQISLLPLVPSITYNFKF